MCLACTTRIDARLDPILIPSEYPEVRVYHRFVHHLVPHADVSQGPRVSRNIFKVGEIWRANANDVAAGILPSLFANVHGIAENRTLGRR